MAAHSTTTDSWLPDLRGGGVKYQAIADSLIQAIEEGKLAAGTRLPPQRELAARLGIDLTTVTKAYDIVRRRGLTEARGRAGSFVRRPNVLPVSELRRLETGMNMPPELPGSLLAKSIAVATAEILGEGSTVHLQYEPSGGSPADRRAGVSLMARLGLQANEDLVVVTAGSQHALHAIVSSTVKAGDIVACGVHTYPGFKAIMASMGVRPLGLDPLCADTLREACREHSITAVYVVPTNDNPTTHTLCASERAAIAEVARERGVTIIEDDAYGLLPGLAVPPIASMAPECTWYISSASKVVSPALRIAYVLAPNFAAALALRGQVYETAVMAPPFNAAIVGCWLRDGTFDRLVNSMRNEANSRQAIARQALQGIGFESQPGGYHLWLPLPPEAHSRDIAEALRSNGLSAHASAHFAVGPTFQNALRISLGGLMDGQTLKQCLQMAEVYISRSVQIRADFI